MPAELVRLGVNLPILALYVVNFLVLLVVLYLLAYRPFLRMLDERESRLREGLEALDVARRLRDEARDERQAAFRAAAEEAGRVIGQAKRAAEDEVRRAGEKARLLSEATLKHARDRIQAEETRAFEQARLNTASLVVQATERVLATTLEPEVHRRLIVEATRHLEALTPLPGGPHSRLARVVSAVPLTDAEIDQFERAIARLCGGPALVTHRQDARLLGGVQVSIDDTFIDGSLAERLNGLSEALGAGGG